MSGVAAVTSKIAMHESILQSSSTINVYDNVTASPQAKSGKGGGVEVTVGLHPPSKLKLFNQDEYVLAISISEVQAPKVAFTGQLRVNGVEGTTLKMEVHIAEEHSPLTV